MSANVPENKLVEQLFLDVSIQDVLGKDARIQGVEPWASMYVDAIRDGRFGDAIWARYHLFGEVENGIVKGSNNMSVLDVIKEDALGYRVGEPEQYAKALSFYATSSSADGHADVIEMISNLAEEDINQLKAKLRAELEAEYASVREEYEERLRAYQ
jgi:hypothetical protein